MNMWKPFVTFDKNFFWGISFYFLFLSIEIAHEVDFKINRISKCFKSLKGMRGLVGLMDLTSLGNFRSLNEWLRTHARPSCKRGLHNSNGSPNDPKVKKSLIMATSRVRDSPCTKSYYWSIV